MLVVCIFWDSKSWTFILYPDDDDDDDDEEDDDDDELFCGIVDWRNVFSFTSSRDRSKRSWPSRISETRQVGFEPTQNLSSGFVEWSCAVIVTSTPRRHWVCFCSTLRENIQEQSWVTIWCVIWYLFGYGYWCKFAVYY